MQGVSHHQNPTIRQTDHYLLEFWCLQNIKVMRTTFTITAFALLAASAVSAQQFVSTQPGPRKALIEEFTGVNCPTCPDQGHAEIAYMLEAHPNDEFYVIMYSPTNSSFTNPSEDATDFRRVFLDDFYMHAYCAPGTLTRAMPSAFINRRIWASGDRWQHTHLWEPYMEEVISSGSSPMNIGVRSVYDEVAQTITMDVEVFYHTTVTAGNSLYVFLGEHDLTSPYQAGSNDSPYIYKSNYFRETVTEGTWGDPITGPTTAGSLYTRQLTFNLADAIDPMNINKVDVLAFIIEDGSTEVYTAVQAPANGGTATTGGTSTSVETPLPTELQMFPNPADGMVSITGLPAGAEIHLTDALGRMLDTVSHAGGTLVYETAHLPKGIYVFNVTSADGASALRLVKN
jgi:hypothetical protein